MKLEIIDENNELDYAFGRWLIKQIQLEFRLDVDPRKLQNWDKFFAESDEYKGIYSTPVKAITILQTALKNLQCDNLPDKLIIKFNQNQFMPGFDRVKVDTLVRLITFGNNSLQGYPIVKDILQRVADNIGDYIKRYVEGF
jgi:hypothetical protein